MRLIPERRRAARLFAPLRPAIDLSPMPSEPADQVAVGDAGIGSEQREDSAEVPGARSFLKMQEEFLSLAGPQMTGARGAPPVGFSCEPEVSRLFCQPTQMPP